MVTQEQFAEYGQKLKVVGAMIEEFQQERRNLLDKLMAIESRIKDANAAISSDENLDRALRILNSILEDFQH